jgi:hypothetical protein
MSRSNRRGTRRLVYGSGQSNSVGTFSNVPISAPETTSAWLGIARVFGGNRDATIVEGQKRFWLAEAEPDMFVVEDETVVRGSWLTTEISENAGSSAQAASVLGLELGPAVMATLKSWEWQYDSPQHRYVGLAGGVGGTLLANLGRGEDRYAEMVADVTALAAAVTEGEVAGIEAYCMPITHGSSDSTVTTPSTYRTGMETWRSNWAADMNAISGRSDNPIMTFDMISFEIAGSDDASDLLCQAFLEDAQRDANDDAMLYNCGARPSLNMRTPDGVHYASWQNYQALAEQHAKVARRVLVDGETNWKPLQYATITARAGNVVRVTLEGGVGGAVLDSRPQTQPGFHDGDKKGFVYIDDGSATIARVDVQATYIDIYLDRQPSTNPTLSHGWTSEATLAKTGRYAADAWGMSRTYVRDSEDTYRSFINGDFIYSWLCPFIQQPVV